MAVVDIPQANIRFDTDWALAQINHFNEHCSYLAGDWAAHRMTLGWDTPAAQALAVVVNALMRTQVPQEDLDLICSFIGGQWAALEPLGHLDPHLPLEEMIHTASEFLPGILCLEGVHQRNYSFATKFLHWASRGLFPIMDSNARTHISGLQRDRLEQFDGEPANPVAMVPRDWLDDLVEDYSRWINFYHNLILGLHEHDEIDVVLLDYDHETQQDTEPDLVLDYSITRVLDKVFWMQAV